MTAPAIATLLRYDAFDALRRFEATITTFSYAYADFRYVIAVAMLAAADFFNIIC